MGWTAGRARGAYPPNMPEMARIHRDVARREVAMTRIIVSLTLGLLGVSGAFAAGRWLAPVEASGWSAVER